MGLKRVKPVERPKRMRRAIKKMIDALRLSLDSRRIFSLNRLSPPAWGRGSRFFAMIILPALRR
jgi:hypothetical protein